MRFDRRQVPWLAGFAAYAGLACGLAWWASGCTCAGVGPMPEGDDPEGGPAATDAGGAVGTGDLTTDSGRGAIGSDAAESWCGDGLCDPGESYAACPSDCPDDTTPPPPPPSPPPSSGSCGDTCGDGTCGPSEHCAVCAADCGACDYTSPTACECSSYGGLEACCSAGSCTADCPGSGTCNAAALGASGKVDCTGRSTCTAILSGGCAWVDCTGVADCTAVGTDCYGNPVPVTPCPNGPGFVYGDCVSADACTYVLGAACIF